MADSEVMEDEEIAILACSTTILSATVLATTQMSTGHFSWTRSDETLTLPDSTRDCRQKVWPDPTRDLTLPPYVHSLIE